MEDEEDRMSRKLSKSDYRDTCKNVNDHFEQSGLSWVFEFILLNEVSPHLISKTSTPLKIHLTYSKIASLVLGLNKTAEQLSDIN